MKEGMRTASELSYRHSINRVAAFIGDHLGEPLDGRILAREAALSRYHFQRVFRDMTGLTPGDYVEFVRLGTAIAELRRGGQQVGRIAERVGYETGAALAKALRRRFGVAPTALRGPDLGPARLRSLDLSAFLRPRHGTRLCPQCVDLPPRAVICTTERGMNHHRMEGAVKRAVGRLEAEADRLALSGRLGARVVLLPDAPASPNDPAFRAIIGFLLHGDPPVPGATGPQVQVATLAGGRFAVFRHQGPEETVWQTWFLAYHDWAAGSGVRLRSALPFQVQVPRADAGATTDIHIPIL
jgi:AraC family transcriptional regulator